MTKRPRFQIQATGFHAGAQLPWTHFYRIRGRGTTHKQGGAAKDIGGYGGGVFVLSELAAPLRQNGPNFTVFRQNSFAPRHPKSRAHSPAPGGLFRYLRLYMLSETGAAFGPIPS